MLYYLNMLILITILLLCVCCAWSLSGVQLFVTPWTVACQAPLSMGILQARILEWIATEHLLFTSCCAKHIHYYFNCHGPVNNIPFLKKEIQARLCWGPCCSSGGVRINRFPCWLAPWEGGANLFLIWGEGKTVFRWSAHPLGDIVCREHAQYPTFALKIMYF